MRINTKAILLFGAIFFTALIKWGPPSDLYILLKHLYIVILALFIVLYIFLDSGKNPEIRYGRSAPFFAAFIIYCCISILWAHNKFFAVKDCIYFAGLFVIYLGVVNLATEDDVLYCVGLVILFAIPVAIYDILMTRQDLFGERLKHLSTFGNPGYVGEYLTMASAACLCFLTGKLKPWIKLLCIAAFALLFFEILLTQTRNSLLALSVCAAVVTYITVRKRNFSNIKYLVIALLVSVSIALAIPGKGYLKRITQGIGMKEQKEKMSVVAGKPVTYSTVKGRFILFEDSLRIIKDNFLFGVGIGNYSIIHPHYKEHIRNKFEQNTKLYSAHNEILNFWSETGLVGVLLLMLLFYHVISPLFKRSFLEGKAGEAAAPLAGILLVTVLQSQFGFDLHRPEYATVFIACLACLDMTQKVVTLHIEKKWFSISSLVLIAALLGMFVFRLNIVQCEIFFQKGMRSYLARDPAGAIEDFKRAYRHNANDEKLVFYLGTSYLMVKDWKSAEELLRVGLGRFPYEQRYYVNYSLTLVEMKRFKEAEEILLKCIKEVPTSYYAYNQLAFIYKNIYNDEAKAQEYVKRSMTTNPFQSPPKI